MLQHSQNALSEKIASGINMVLLKKVVVAEMQGSDGPDDFWTFKQFTTLQPAKQGNNCDEIFFEVLLKKALFEEHLACWVCSKLWEPFISFLAS